jgi:phosphoserine phosphatase RsbU/P
VTDENGQRSDRRRASIRAGAVAAGAAGLSYLLATTIELLVIRQFAPSETELTWIGDAALAVALGVAVYIWLDLRWTRLTLSRLQRAQIVLDTQLSLAADIQRGLLPALPGDSGPLRWAARLVPAGRIGGDLYDVVQPTADSWLLLVGDVSGKGVPAALLLTSIRTMFRMMISDTHDPGELATRISSRLYEDYGGTPYLTCVVLRIDLATRELTYVNAGHPAGFVLDDGNGARAPWLLASSGPPAGMLSGQAYHSTSLPLPAKAISILVTDGITEAFDMLGATGDPVAALLAQMPRPLVPAHICDALIDRTSPALSMGDWQDDRTVVAFATIA